MTCGIITGPEAALQTRAPIKVSGLGASAQSSEALVKPPIPTSSIRRRPKRSPSRPPVSSSTASASV
jgi:hypothetical protein